MSLTAPRVTDNTNEMSCHDLVSSKAQLKTPLFQRSYVWGRNQLGRMTKEFPNIVARAKGEWVVGRWPKPTSTA
jgi:hypothetical protein